MAGQPIARKSKEGRPSSGGLLTAKLLGRPLAITIALEEVIQSPSFGTTLNRFSHLKSNCKGIFQCPNALQHATSLTGWSS